MQIFLLELVAQKNYTKDSEKKFKKILETLNYLLTFANNEQLQSILSVALSTAPNFVAWKKSTNL